MVLLSVKALHCEQALSTLCCYCERSRLPNVSTSPSVYLEVVGTIAANDRCREIGSTLTSPYIAVPSGGLSTYEMRKGVYSIGQEYYDPNKVLGVFIGTVKPFNPADL